MATEDLVAKITQQIADFEKSYADALAVVERFNRAFARHFPGSP